ncbi:hypothetical protein ACTFIZ_012374 [Dictyostelium cf. discoideum]
MNKALVLLDKINLSEDSQANDYIKSEQVSVKFAKQAGQVLSSVGINDYQVGDAIIATQSGESWNVSYQNHPHKIRAKQMPFAFSIARSTGGDILQGAAFDWLVEYAPGDYGIVQRFHAVYRLADGV